MPIKPKYKVSEKWTILQQSRIFTDRKNFIEVFRRRLRLKHDENYCILNYYGVGGIGKSALRKEFGNILSKEFPHIIWSHTDFELQSFREAETSLFHIRKNFKEKYKIEFPTFDIAYTVYWQKSHPQITLAKDNIPFLEDGSLIANLLSSVGEVPMVGLLPSIAKAVIRGKSFLKKWWIKRGQKELYDIPSLSPKEILDRLPMYFAMDLRDYLKSNSITAVIFIDTYDGLLEISISKEDFF